MITARFSAASREASATYPVIVLNGTSRLQRPFDRALCMMLLLVRLVPLYAWKIKLRKTYDTEPGLP